jgi:two-component system C4-dicarboxylate transport sensor histidine kinase DctB
MPQRTRDVRHAQNEAAAPPPASLNAAELLAQVEALSRQVDALHAEVADARRLATLGTLTAFIAHEFNNILTPILSYSQLAQAHPEDKELVRKALSRASSGAEKASRIAQTILALSKTEKRPADGTAEPLVADVKTLVSESLVTIWLDPNVKSIKVVSDVPDDLFASISPVAFQQVLTNLLSNACKALAGKGGGLISITGRSEGSSTGNSGRVIVEVEDNGPGVRPDILPRLFHPFVTTADPRKPTEGTGLGLTICQRLIEEVGGTIRVESASGVGAKFIISLPVASAPISLRVAKRGPKAA